MTSDESEEFDALTSAGSTATVFIRSDAAPIATVTAATFNGAAIPIGDGGMMSLPAATRGTNLLRMTIEGIDAGDDVQLVEDCGDGENTVLKTKHIGAAPGGANPLLGFRIHAS